MNPKQLTELLSKTIPSGTPTLTLGAPGIGKSDIHSQAAKIARYDYLAIYPALLDPTDLSGLPIPVTDKDGTRAVERLLDGDLAGIFARTDPLLILLDEIGQASTAMQSACAPLLLARKIGKYTLPDCVTVAAATNRRTDRAGASAILTHLISRCITVELNPDLDNFSDWAIQHKTRPEVVSFLRWRPKLLHDFDAEKSSSGTQPYPCPRSWANPKAGVSGVLNLNLSHDVEMDAISGCIGKGAATEFMAHLTISRELPNLDEILNDPSSLKIPQNPSARYALCSGLAFRSSNENADAIVEIAEKMHRGKLGEYAVLLIHDSLKANLAFSSTKAFNKLSNSALGKMIRETGT